MTRRLTNLLLFCLVVALLVTGLLGWILPETQAFVHYDLHRALGIALLVLLFWKQDIVRASLRWRLRRPRWDRSVLVGIVAGLVFLGSAGIGAAWTLGLVSFDSLWGYSPLNVHVYFAFALTPFLIWHVFRRAQASPPVVRLVTRRSLLRLAGLAVASLLSWRVLDSATGVLATSGTRRPSGSKYAGSFTGNAYPITNWFLDPVPALDAASWRLDVRGKVIAPGFMTYQELRAMPSREVEAVLDCTGGWWSEQRWTGVPIGDVLALRGVDPSARWVEVISVTNHRWTFPLDHLREALLATHVGGEILTPGHGYPVRLVVPGRRGFQWVKWVGRLEVF